MKKKKQKDPRWWDDIESMTVLLVPPNRISKKIHIGDLCVLGRTKVRQAKASDLIWGIYRRKNEFVIEASSPSEHDVTFKL